MKIKENTHYMSKNTKYIMYINKILDVNDSGVTLDLNIKDSTSRKTIETNSLFKFDLETISTFREYKFKNKVNNALKKLKKRK